MFQVAPDANKIEIKQAIEKLLGVEGREHPHEHRARQGQAAGPVRRPALGLEEGLRQAARRREDAGIPGGGVVEGLEWDRLPIAQKYNRRRPARGSRPCRPSTRSRRSEPYKPLVEPLHSTGGRNNQGD